jgi:peptide/nickel transport system substrate-binding protein
MSELTQINPIPQHAWDKTSVTGKVGDYDTTPGGARAVYRFLDAQSRNKGSYASNPLWQVVDGPWQLSSFDSSGRAKFVPNKKYSGSPKPKLDSFTEVPFTSGESEYNSLRAGSLTYGYIPQTDLAQQKVVESKGYQVDPWYLWSMNIVPINLNNPRVGPMFKQLYVRQAMQSLINQKQYVSSILHNDGAVDNGPVPTLPATQYLTDTLRNGAYPYSVARARSLLSAHGWTVRANGVSTCSRPGTAADACGAGVASGAKLAFSLSYASGIPEVAQEMQAWKSDLSRVGIQLTLSQAPLNTVFSEITPCKPNQSTCSWQMAYWGNGWEFAPDYYPSGEVAFSTGAIGNWGSYSDPQMDAKIKATTTQAGLDVFHSWADYTARQLPMLFMPLSAVQISAISNKLQGAIPQQVAGQALTPESWYLTK